MAYLLYGIVKDPAVVGASITGVKGQPVIFVEAHGLCAAVSELVVEEGAPPVAELIAYAQVVEALHHRQAVVPMRYGCFLNGIPAIQDILKARRGQYEALLSELAGHAEMGIRILLPERKCENISSEGTTLPEDEPVINGRAYLALRKVHYQTQEATTHGRQALIDRYIKAFSGLYTQHRAETEAKKDAVILSLYFLTPESKVNLFRETFGDMMAEGNDEALLSGPWPPYNFVTTEIGKYGDTIPNPG